MRRNAALIPLTHDHHDALAQVRRMRVAARASPEDWQAAGEEFVQFFRADTVLHFREEEEILFPLVVDEADLSESLERVMIDHLRIHALVNRLTAESSRGEAELDTLLKLAVTLEEHIRFEEKVLFPLIEKRVRKPRLDAIALRPRQRERAS